MKLILTLLAISALSFCHGQGRHKGFVYIGPAAYQPLKTGNTFFGGAMGFGVFKGIGSLGISIEALSEKKNITFPVYADVRIHFKKAPSGPFVMIQPGYAIANNTISKTNTGAGAIVTKQEGGIYIGGGVGFISLINKVGIIVQLKAAIIGNKVSTTGPGIRSSATKEPGFIGLSFGAAF